MPWNNNMWFNLLALVDKSLWNFPSVGGCLGACLMDNLYAHRWPFYKGCSFLSIWPGRLLWTSLELVQFSTHHHLQIRKTTKAKPYRVNLRLLLLRIHCYKNKWLQVKGVPVPNTNRQLNLYPSTQLDL